MVIVERSNVAAASGASGGGGGGGLIVEEQQEKLRRFVDEWRGQVSETVERLADNGLMGVVASTNVGDINHDPLHITTACSDDDHHDVTVLDIIPTKNLFSKVMTVLSFDCLQIARLRQLV
jgi:hypothetical protein